MDTSNTLFREYILWRAKANVYGAVFLAITAVISLVVLISASPMNINRAGLLLQLIGVLTLLPDVVGKERFKSFGQPNTPIPATGHGGARAPSGPGAPPSAPLGSKSSILYRRSSLR